MAAGVTDDTSDKHVKCQISKRVGIMENVICQIITYLFHDWVAGSFRNPSINFPRWWLCFCSLHHYCRCFDLVWCDDFR